MKKRMQRTNENKGQALVTLLVFTAVALVIAGGIAMLAVSSTQSTSLYTQNINAYYLAEAGIENALIQLIRDSSYRGETLNLENGTVTITVSGRDDRSITAVGDTGTYKRTVEVKGTYEENKFIITSWEEI